MNDTHLARLRCDSDRYSITQLSEFGFRTDQAFRGNTLSKWQGMLELGDVELPITFRIRDDRNDSALGSFANIDSEKRRLIRDFLRQGSEATEVGCGNEPQSGKVDSFVSCLTGNTDGAADPIDQRKLAFECIADEFPPEEIQAEFRSRTPDLRESPLNRIGEEQQDQTDDRLDCGNVQDDVMPILFPVDNVASTGAVLLQHVLQEDPSSVPRLMDRESGMSATNISDAQPVLAVPECSATRTAPAFRAQPLSADRRTISWPVMVLLFAALVGMGWWLGASRPIEMMTSDSGPAITTDSGQTIIVNVPMAGTVKQILGDVGQPVRAGDVLARLESAELNMMTTRCRADIDAAKTKIQALEQERQSLRARLSTSLAKQKLELARLQSELGSTEKLQQIAKRAVDRLSPYVSSGAVTKKEFDEAMRELLSYETVVKSLRDQMELIQMDQSTGESTDLGRGENSESQLDRIETELTFTRTDIRRAEKLLVAATEQAESLIVRAPLAGEIKSVLIHVDQMLQSADQAFSIENIQNR